MHLAKKINTMYKWHNNYQESVKYTTTVHIKKMLCLYPAIRIVYILHFHPKQRIILTSISDTAKCNHFMLVKIIQKMKQMGALTQGP